MILVTGATGTTGREIVRQLAAAGLSFRVMARDRQKAQAILGSEGGETVEGDFGQPATLDRALDGVDKVFLLSSPSPQQVEQQNNMIDAARRARNVKHVVKLSAIGADPNSRVRLLKQHGQIEKHLEDSGLTFTHLRPNSFMQNALGFASTVKKQGAFYTPAKQGRVSFVDARDVAAVAAAALSEPGHENRSYTITGPAALSYAEVAEKISNAIGTKVTYVDVSPEAAKKGMTDAGLSEWMADAINELSSTWSEDFGAEVTNVISEVVSKQPNTYDDFLRDFAPVFKN